MIHKNPLKSKLTKITGKVVHGAKYGSHLGFPTANIDRRQYVRDDLKIRLGIWAGVVEIQNEEFRMKNKKAKIPHSYKAAIVIGPTDHRGLPKLEAHLLNFEGNLYGKKISIILGNYLRPFKKFKNETELKSQIAKDVKVISEI